MNAAFTISPMRIEHFDRVLALWQRTEGVGLGAGDDKSSIEKFLQRNPDLSFIAQNTTGKIIGAVLCGHDGRRAFMYHLAVDAEDRRQGIGRALVENCLSALNNIGIEKCNLMVFEENDPGKQFWIRAGWKDRPDLLLMQKPTGAV